MNGWTSRLREERRGPVQRVSRGVSHSSRVRGSDRRNGRTRCVTEKQPSIGGEQRDIRNPVLEWATTDGVWSLSTHRLVRVERTSNTLGAASHQKRHDRPVPSSWNASSGRLAARSRRAESPSKKRLRRSVPSKIADGARSDPAADSSVEEMKCNPSEYNKRRRLDGTERDGGRPGHEDDCTPPLEEPDVNNRERQCRTGTSATDNAPNESTRE